MKYLTKSETDLLFSEIYKDESKHRLRNIALFELAKYCALRASELSKMKIDDYDSENHTIHCYRLKSSNDNVLKIVDKHVIKALEDYLQERTDKYKQFNSTYMFLSQKGTPLSRQRMDAIIKNYCKTLNIPKSKCHMHTLRHTRAIELAELGFDIDDIQFWLGHKNIKNTLKYLKYTNALKNQMICKLEKLEIGEYKVRF